MLNKILIFNMFRFISSWPILHFSFQLHAFEATKNFNHKSYGWEYSSAATYMLITCSYAPSVLSRPSSKWFLENRTTFIHLHVTGSVELATVFQSPSCWPVSSVLCPNYVPKHIQRRQTPTGGAGLRPGAGQPDTPFSGFNTTSLGRIDQGRLTNANSYQNCYCCQRF